MQTILFAYSFFMGERMELLDAYKVFLDKGEYGQAFECLKVLYPSEYQTLVDFRNILAAAIIDGKSDDIKLLRSAWGLSAKDRFEDFCIFHEWDREDKFYMPRRKGLKPVVDALQRLADDELDLLCVSMPPGTGKTGLAIYFMAWLCGRNPKDAILGSSHNASFLRGVYDEILKELTADEYGWKDLFKRKVVRTNAQDLKIDVDQLQRFPSVQFTSIGAGNSGKCRAVQLLYVDDIVEGEQEALSPERLAKKYQLYTVDLKQRKQGDKCKELHIATRWSVHDVIGVLQQINANNPRALFISMPALDEHGNSNFDYGGSIGFTKEFYEEMKNSMDDYAFRALYMNEPIEREGLLYQAKELRRFYSLPEEQPDAVLAVCDTSEGKGDDTVMIIGYVYGEEHYIADVVCSDERPDIVNGLCANAIVKHRVKSCRFESNSGGARMADKVYELALEQGVKCNITKKYTTANKETKIVHNAPWVIEHCLFMDDNVMPKGGMYQRFFRLLTSYSMKGRNKHDDCPDAMAQYALFCDITKVASVTVGRRIF